MVQVIRKGSKLRKSRATGIVSETVKALPRKPSVPKPRNT